MKQCWSLSFCNTTLWHAILRPSPHQLLCWEKLDVPREWSMFTHKWSSFIAVAAASCNLWPQQPREVASKSMRWKQTASIIFAGRLTNLSSLSSSQMFASQFYKSKIYISVHPRSLRRILRHFMVVSLLLSLLITLRMIVAINPGKCPRSCSLKGGVEIIKHLSYKGRRILVNVVGKK